METRELRYFVAVAEELHFGRAAERLGIAQPPLSRAISQLERRLGVTLLDRGRTVTLTPPGSVLLEEARAALTAVEAAERRTVRAAAALAGEPGIVLVTKAGSAGELLPKLLDAYAAEPGAVPVEVVLCSIHEHERMLRDGTADVALLHLPFDEISGLDTEVIETQGSSLLLPAGHPLSTRRELSMEEVDALLDLPRPRWPLREGGYQEGSGPEVHDSTQLVQLISLGRTATVLPGWMATLAPGQVVAVPVPDAPPVTTVIAWPAHSRSQAVAGLVRTATRL